MHPARLSFLASRHAPLVRIESVTERDDATSLSLACGHVAEMAPHFTYKLGSDCRCYACGRDLAGKMED